MRTNIAGVAGSKPAAITCRYCSFEKPLRDGGSVPLSEFDCRPREISSGRSDACHDGIVPCKLFACRWSTVTWPPEHTMSPELEAHLFAPHGSSPFSQLVFICQPDPPEASSVCSGMAASQARKWLRGTTTRTESGESPERHDRAAQSFWAEFVAKGRRCSRGQLISLQLS